MMGSWVKDLQDRVRRASNDVNTVLQPRISVARRHLEEGIEQMKGRGRELYADDASLSAALAALDSTRAHVRELAATVDTQRAHLLNAAQAQRTLGDTLAAPAPVDTPVERAQATAAFAAAQTAVASVHARFALDMSTPMADLARTFEERYHANVAPLKKRHASAKQEYLRHVRAAENVTDTDFDVARRERMNALAQNALPAATRASEELQDEIRALLAHATSSMCEWALNVAQAQADTYSRAAEILQEPKRLAEKAQDAALQ